MLFLCVGFFYWTIVPYMQSSEYLSDLQQAFSTGNYTVLLNDPFIFNPDSNVEGILRSDFLREVVNQYQSSTPPQSLDLLNEAISEMEEYLTNHPSYYTYILSLANGYELKSDITKNPADFADAVKTYQEDMAVVPGRQDIIYAYAVALVQHNQTDQALALLRDSVNKNPTIGEVHFQLANVLMFLNNPQYYAEAFSNFEDAINSSPTWITSNSAELKMPFQTLLKYFYAQNDFNDFYTVVSQLSIIDPDQKDIYMNVLGYMKAYNKIPDLNIGGAAATQ